MATTIDPRTAWEPYTPTAENPWDLRKVGHVYRRAAFGATWAELEAGLKAGPQPLIDRLLKGGEPSPLYDDQTDEFLSSAARKFNVGPQASAWWLYRMLHGGHPLREKLTLFWHNHFATSNAKVQNAGYMVGQYELMYRHALGNFAELLQAMSKDPAMMVWLDTVQSKKGQPNENYARELMELFSLGIGNYTEKDIREGARAFTGWELKNGQFFSNKAQFDPTEKTFLGKTGKWTGEDIVRICLEQKAAPRFIVRKLYRFLISEGEAPSPDLIEPLAVEFANGYDFGKLVERMLRSNLFFSEHAYRARIKAPVDYVLGMARALEAHMGTQNAALNLTQAMENLGQNVFHPPSVKGWDGGQSWLNGQTLLFRQNLALDLARRPAGYREPSTAFRLAEAHGKKADEERAEFFLQLFLQRDVPEETRKRIFDYAKTASKHKVPAYWTQQDIAENRVISLCHLVMTLPEYQLS
ncbi:MAG: DUF1800 domain-containing protein [Zavarzinella sp.]|nr:DUF1800 domain-containing protein [Zavarzinella sp.]